jgi:hypothetical protein
LLKAGFGRSYIRSALGPNEGLICVKRYPYKSPDIELVTSEKGTYVVKSTPVVDRVIRATNHAQPPLRRNRLGQWVSDAPD